MSWDNGVSLKLYLPSFQLISITFSTNVCALFGLYITFCDGDMIIFSPVDSTLNSILPWNSVISFFSALVCLIWKQVPFTSIKALLICTWKKLPSCLYTSKNELPSSHTSLFLLKAFVYLMELPDSIHTFVLSGKTCIWFCCAITFINSSLILSLIEFIQNPPIVSKRASEATAKCHLSSVRTLFLFLSTHLAFTFSQICSFILKSIALFSDSFHCILSSLSTDSRSA